MICFTNSRKRILFLLILIPLFSSANQQLITDKALELKLYTSHVWKNLIHVKGDIPSINHPSFLLSYPQFSLKNELKMTIESFFKTTNIDDRHAICKYPARYLWVKQELGLRDSDFPAVHCQSFDQYLQRTAANDLKLIFVSENTTNPSSMMGHVFFKLSGVDKHHIKREHAVSFFTVIDTMNIPALIVKSTITGMKGYFLLRPYKEQIERYLEEENRNIWEYSLSLSKFEQQLIYYHFWELKDVKIKYLFTGFNCATIVHDMLSMTSNELSKDAHLWVTPKDVIKDAEKHKLIQGVSLQASNEWQIKMLLDELGEIDDSSFIKQLENTALSSMDTITWSSNTKTAFLEKELLAAYSKYQYSNHDINVTTFSEINSMITVKNDFLDDSYVLDLNNYKDPIDTFNDTQVRLSYLSGDGSNDFLLSFLPASNTIYDDNRQYFGETDLRIMELNLLINKNEVKVDSFNLFNMKSLLPRDNLTGGISSSFVINYESQYDTQLGEYKAYNISGGLGYTKQYFNDIFLYTLLNVGMAYGESKFYAYVYPEVGLLMYEVFDMKTVLTYKYIYNQHNSHEGYHDVRLEQSFFIDQKVRVGLGIEHKSILKYNKPVYRFSLSYFF